MIGYSHCLQQFHKYLQLNFIQIRFYILTQKMEDIKQKYIRIKNYLNEKNYDAIQKILAADSKAKQILSYKDIQGRSLIFHAMFVPDEQFNIKITDLFLHYGADPKDKQINKQSIIFYIAKDGKLNLLKKLLKFGFNLNDNDYMNQTPLFYTAKQGKITASEILIENGCDVNHKDSNGQTCLFYGARFGQLDICKLLAKHGCNMLHHDKNRVKASQFAKIQGHKQVVEYLNQFKYEARKIKQEKGAKQSSMNEKKRKKESSKNEYSLAFCNEHGQVIELTSEQLIQFKKACETNEKIFEMLRNPELAQIEPQGITEKKFQKVALKIINYFWKLQNAHFFYEPVDYVRQNLHDYPNIVKYPMDFGTIKKKLSFNAYESEEQFKNDMNLVFDNCILYNGMQSVYGKIAMEMKLEFNTMYIKELFSGNI